MGWLFVAATCLLLQLAQLSTVKCVNTWVPYADSDINGNAPGSPAGRLGSLTDNMAYANLQGWYGVVYCPDAGAAWFKAGTPEQLVSNIVPNSHCELWINTPKPVTSLWRPLPGFDFHGNAPGSPDGGRHGSLSDSLGFALTHGWNGVVYCKSAFDNTGGAWFKPGTAAQLISGKVTSSICDLWVNVPPNGPEALACGRGFRSVEGVCSPCPVGTYSSSVGSTSCTLCASNTFSPTPGSAYCIPCPANTASASGAQQCTPCHASNLC